MNGSYPGYYYYDFYPQGEGYAHYSSPSHSNKRAQYGREGRGESKDSKDSDKSSHDGDDKEKNFNDDFPSLNGTDEDAEVKPSKSGNGGVWALAGVQAQQQSPTPPIEILSSRLVRQPKPLGLLREMGWDEQDDEVYEITEDDKREFKQLTDKLQQQRNGPDAHAAPKRGVPKHMTSFKPQPQELNETLSSSDTDSDELISSPFHAKLVSS
nr:hypothetical protein BaRGS_010923 [Batillaria attramentaria]